MIEVLLIVVGLASMVGGGDLLLRGAIRVADRILKIVLIRNKLM